MDSRCAELAHAHPSHAWVPRWSTIGIAIALSFGLTAVFTFTGEAMAHFFCAALAGAAAVPLWFVLVFSALALQHSRRAAARAIASALSQFSSLLVWMLLVQVPAFITTEYVRDAKVASAKRWCESTAAKLDEWHANHGRYPAELAELGLEPERPTFCAEGISGLLYQGDDSGFSVDFADGGLLSGWVYTSGSRKWYRYD